MCVKLSWARLLTMQLIIKCWSRSRHSSKALHSEKAILCPRNSRQSKKVNGRTGCSKLKDKIFKTDSLKIEFLKIQFLAKSVFDKAGFC